MKTQINMYGLFVSSSYLLLIYSEQHILFFLANAFSARLTNMTQSDCVHVDLRFLPNTSMHTVERNARYIRQAISGQVDFWRVSKAITSYSTGYWSHRRRYWQFNNCSGKIWTGATEPGCVDLGRCDYKNSFTVFTDAGHFEHIVSCVFTNLHNSVMHFRLTCAVYRNRLKCVLSIARWRTLIWPYRDVCKTWFGTFKAKTIYTVN